MPIISFAFTPGFCLAMLRRLKLQNVRVPLTNNAQILVAHGESTSNSKAGNSL